MEEITTRTLDAAGMTPVRAYAALRAKAPGRGSFLLEMTEPDEAGEQRSTIGFLGKREAAHPPTMDAVKDLAATTMAMPAASELAAVAAACCGDVLALLMFDSVLPANRLSPWPEQAFVGRELRDVASVVFDHGAGTFTIAATNVNVVERCARVIAAAPELSELPAAGGDRPLYLFEDPPAGAFAKLYGRAQRRLSMGGLDRVMMGRTFTAPARGAELFDVFRAMRALARQRHHFFVELGTSPMFPPLSLTGSARTSARIPAQSDAEGIAREMHALFPIEARCGAPAADALAAWRDIGAGPIGLHGGLIARVRPGATVDVLCSDAFVLFENEQLHTMGLAALAPERDAAAHSTAAEADVTAAFAAIRLAHELAEAREAAATAAAEAAALAGEAAAAPGD